MYRSGPNLHDSCWISNTFHFPVWLCQIQSKHVRCLWLKSHPECLWWVKFIHTQSPGYLNGIPKFWNSLSNTRIWVLEALNIIFWKHMILWEGVAAEKWSISNHKLSHFWIEFKQERLVCVCVCVCLCVSVSVWGEETGCCNCYELLKT